MTKAVLSALAKERKRLAATAPKLPRGRPRAIAAARRAVRRKKRIENKVSDLFENRYLFVQRRLSPIERATLRRVSRGLPELRVLRELMEEVYRLFDRRCRTATAIAKLVALRDRLQRSGRLQAVLKKLLSPGLEKALVFLDERLMGATSNAVERGNRRYRKMQKTVYRVRTQRAIDGRLALDLLRRVRPKAGTAPPRPCTRLEQRETFTRFPRYSVGSFLDFPCSWVVNFFLGFPTENEPLTTPFGFDEWLGAWSWGLFSRPCLCRCWRADSRCR